MKVVKTASGNKTIKMSKKEWQSIGNKAGWIKKANASWSIEKIDENHIEYDQINGGEQWIAYSPSDIGFHTDSLEDAFDNIATRIKDGDTLSVNNEPVDIQKLLMRGTEQKDFKRNYEAVLVNFHYETIPFDIKDSDGNVIVPSQTPISIKMLKDLNRKWPNVSMPPSPIFELLKNKMS